MANEQIHTTLLQALTETVSAVRVPEKHSFIAIVNNRSKKTIAQKLTKMGIENFLPIRKEIHNRENGKKAIIEQVLFPSKIFIRCTEQERCELVTLPFLFRVMSDYAGSRYATTQKSLAIVPDDEIRQLQFLLELVDGDGVFSDRPVKGKKAEVLKGPMQGLLGEISTDRISGVCFLFVNVDGLGSASVVVNPSDVKEINDCA